uniref:Ph-3 resistance protein n=1 Tax=Solanum pimpinellifolium TaxID=4084 RepID=A0A060D304_SOLPI|nr:Ph-3 resistance protein [Solanum pimpinellifolium]
MADILLTAVVNKSVEIAANLLVQEGTRLHWLREDIDWLQREMRHIRSYVDDAKAKEVGGDSRVKNLLEDIQQLAGDVEDLLDEFLPKIQQSNKFICCLKTVSFADKFAMEIEKIKRRVADIDRVRTTYNITDTSNNNDDCIPMDRRRRFLHANDETEVIGLDHDFNKLQHKLLLQDLPYGVVSIVGMPGLGKTTLAKKLYRHVRHQFECSGLVYVSQQPRAGEILLNIAKQVGLTEEERKENLEHNLRSLLKIKRYVILLDDIWDVEIWDDLKLVLPESDSKIGSRIIITSRNSNVGRYIGGDFSIHELQPLDSENSFELFTKKICNFVDDNWANTSPDLVNIGRCIVERCGGIPLAIVVTAGMLRARGRTEHAWNRVLDSMTHKIQEGCAKVLALSYNDLPIALRPCFLYFGLFPEDHEIRAFDLINMWIAEKLIVVNSGNTREAESKAEDFLNDLVSRNLIQVAKRRYDGRISTCRIHDLLHSLCVELGKESNFFHTEHNAFGDPGNVSRVRRITFYSDINAMNEFLRSNPNPKKLRALFCFIGDSCLFSQLARHDFKLLQVLVVVIAYDYFLSYMGIPNTFGKTSCLRYLQLEGNMRGKLPNSMVKHMQTLNIENSCTELPTVVWESKQLRHVRYRVGFEASNCCFSISRKIYSLPPNNIQTLMCVYDKFVEQILFHRLINLRKLGLWIVSDFTVQILSTLPKELEDLKLIFSCQPSEQMNLSSYPYIVKLHLSGNVHLNSVTFPPNLVKLTLRLIMVEGYVVALLKKLSKLRILKMIWCKHKEEKMDLSGDGDSFLQLEVLYIQEPSGLSEVECTDDVSMPKLKKLLLKEIPNSNLRLSKRLAKLRV